MAETRRISADVASNRPGSESTISRWVGPNDIEAPEVTVVSFVILDPEDIDFASLESDWMTFCKQIHLFNSSEQTEAWPADCDFNFAVLAVQDTYEIGKIAFADMTAATAE